MKSVFTFDDGLVLAGIVGVSPAQPAGEAGPFPQLVEVGGTSCSAHSAGEARPNDDSWSSSTPIPELPALFRKYSFVSFPFFPGFVCLISLIFLYLQCYSRDGMNMALPAAVICFYEQRVENQKRTTNFLNL